MGNGKDVDIKKSMGLLRVVFYPSPRLECRLSVTSTESKVRYLYFDLSIASFLFDSLGT